MAESTSKTLKYELIKREISRETLPNLPKEKLKTYCKDLGLKVAGEKDELAKRLAPLGESEELFEKKVGQIQKTFIFNTVLNVSEISPANACWKVVGKNEDVNVPVVDENMIREYQKAKYVGAKGQYRKAHRMFTSRRIMSVKFTKTLIQARLLKRAS